MPSAYKAHLHHAHYYVEIASRARVLYKEGGVHIKAGLELFDGERAQIDTGLNWARRQSGHSETDQLLLQYAGVTAYIGLLRYDTQTERIPQLAVTVEAARRLGRKMAEGSALGNLGLALMAIGDVHQAIAYYEQHLALARETDDRVGESNALGNLGNAYRNLGQPQHAVTYYA
ncbi:MAG: tetratricopeptide repeat protein [Chloroflexales bacterium]